MRSRRKLLAAALLGLSLVACSTGATPTPVATPPSPGATPTAPPTAAPTQPPASASEQTAGGKIKCDLGGHENAYHIHALVGVKVDGQLYAPPANIGISSTCIYWVHTHNTDAIVHVEAPANVSPTLGDFLDLWAQSYPDDQLLAAARDAIAAGKVTVDDAPISSNPLDLVFQDKMRIILGS
jgi:hypothetical protein